MSHRWAQRSPRWGETELERRVGGRHLEPFELRRGHRRRTSRKSVRWRHFYTCTSNKPRDVLALLQAQFQTEQVPVDAHALGALVKRNGKIKKTWLKNCKHAFPTVFLASDMVLYSRTLISCCVSNLRAWTSRGTRLFIFLPGSSNNNLIGCWGYS